MTVASTPAAEKVHGHGMSEGMSCHVLGLQGQGRPVGRCTACLATSTATASLLRRRPRLVGNSGPVRLVAALQPTRRAAPNSLGSQWRGALFSALPLATEVGARPSCTSPQHSPVSSDTLSPVCTAKSSRA